MPELITADELRRTFDYDPETGIFTRKTSRARAPVGKIAGRVVQGYLLISYLSRAYAAHRLAWLHFYGEWPKGQIDHINRVKLDNRISNLRDVTPAENTQNNGLFKNNKSGRKGVSWNKMAKKWRAQIGHQNKLIFLGEYRDKDDAAKAYARAASQYHTCNPEAMP